MGKLTENDILQIKNRPLAEEVITDLPDTPGGSFQELEYYRCGVKRAEALLPYWDKINTFDLPGIDYEFYNNLAAYKRLFDADDALTRLKFRLASKALNPKLIISYDISLARPEVKSIFDIIKELPSNMDYHYTACYKEALRAFGRFGVESFLDYLEYLINLNTFIEFKKTCEDYIECNNHAELPSRFSALLNSYEMLVDSVKAFEAEEFSIGYGDYEDSDLDFGEIFDELKHTEGDFDWVIRTLEDMPDNQCCESEWKDERGCYFGVNIDPRYHPFTYAIQSLRLYSYIGGRYAPYEIEELINNLSDKWKSMFTLLERKFAFIGTQVDAARNAFETFMSTIEDPDRYIPGDISSEVICKTNIQAIESAMRCIAQSLEKSHTKPSCPTEIILNHKTHSEDKGRKLQKTKRHRQVSHNSSLSNRWKKLGRFEVSSKCQDIRLYDENKSYEKFLPYYNITKPTEANKVIKILLAEYGKSGSEGWRKSNKKWRTAFTKKYESTYRFKNEQIEVGSRSNGHLGEWRIIPDKAFDEHYRKRISLIEK